MNRGYLINHLINQECYPDEEWSDPTAGQLWRNAINGHVCYVPYDEELAIMTWCHAIAELKILPPLEFDADYDVYCSWKNGPYKEKMSEQEKEDDRN